VSSVADPTKRSTSNRGPPRALTRPWRAPLGAERAAQHGAYQTRALQRNSYCAVVYGSRYGTIVDFCVTSIALIIFNSDSLAASLLRIGCERVAHRCFYV